MFLLYKTQQQYYIQVYGDKILFPSCTEVTVFKLYENSIGRPVKKKVCTTENGIRYIVWDGEGIALNNYLSFTKEKFLRLFPCDKDTTVSNILVYSTLAKYAKDLAFITKAQPYTAALPSISDEEFDLDNPKDMHFVLSTKGYSIDDWDKDITLTPYNKQYWRHYADIVCTTDDFVEFLKNGDIKVVDQVDFLETETSERYQFECLSKRKQKKNLEEFKKQHSIMI
jgi:hypothetical protein